MVTAPSYRDTPHNASCPDAAVSHCPRAPPSTSATPSHHLLMSAHSSPVIRRARVTYGRRDKAPDVDSLLADTSVISNGSSVDEPPSSDGLDLDASSFMEELRDDDDEVPSRIFDTEAEQEQETDDVDVPAEEIEYSWKRKLAAMDDSDDEEGQNMVKSQVARLFKDKEERANSLTGDEERGDAGSPQSRSGGSPATKSPSHDSQTFRPILADFASSPIPTRPSRSRLAVLSDPEEDEANPSSPQTPAHSLHHLNTPHRHSSPTPPTSTETASKKGKAQAAKIPALLFDEGHSDDEQPARSKARGKKAVKQKEKPKEKRMKPPTRKEREEMEKTTARLKAAHTVEVSRVQTKKMTLTQLYHRMPGPVEPSKGAPFPRDVIPPSDPIEPFSSSPRAAGPADPPSPPPRARTVSQPPAKATAFDFPLSDDSDDELPELSDILKQSTREDEERRRLAANKDSAAQRKQRFLEMQAEALANTAGDDDDDLVVSNDMHAVAREEGAERKRKSFRGSRTQPAPHRPRPSASTSAPRDESFLVTAAAGAFASPSKKAKNGRDQVKVKPSDLNAFLLGKTHKEAQEIIEQKEKVWVGMGGKVLGRMNPEDRAGFEKRLGSLVERGLSNAEKEGLGEEEEADDSDEDWKPNDEEAEDNAEEAQEDDDDGMVIPQSEEAAWGDGAEDAGLYLEEDEADENAPVIARRPRPRARTVAIADSDDEENENADLNTRSASEENAENETDKENNAALMFDQGEDKENTVVHLSSSPTIPPLFRDARLGRQLSLSSDVGDPMSQDNEPRLFREITKDEDPFFTPSARLPAPSAPSLDLDAPSTSASQPPAFSLKPAPLLRGGFSQLFESSATEAGPSSKPAVDFSQFVTPAKDVRGFGLLKKPGEPLALSFNPTLQPALEVTDSVRKKADHIFEKEQEDITLIDENAPAESPKVYVNENGFLTQTRPTHADVARLMSSSQSSRIGISPSIADSILRSTAQRRPLGEIALDDVPNDHSSPWTDARPAGGRLKRRRMSPGPDLDGGYRSSVSPSPSPTKNAFQVMRDAQKHPNPLKKMKLKKSEFVDGQAEESDEDDHFGFGGPPKKKDEDEEEEDNVEELAKLNKEMVDDVAMDDSTLNEEMVLEKHREQVEEDDAVAHKLAQDAASGKLRAKRRERGVGFEDDEDSDEDDDNKARRYKLGRQKRKLGGDCDTLDDLSKDAKAAAFVQTYEAGLEDDNEEFSHLNEELPTQQEEAPKIYEDEDEESDKDDEQVSLSTLMREMRDVAQGHTTVRTMDPNDMSWLDDDEMMVEDDPNVKELSKSRVGRTLRAGPSDWDFEGGVRPQFFALLILRTDLPWVAAFAPS
ncbi:hypothetical protein EIP91_012067 [Steccherinum ochraceum]|uniref:DNA replication checkpoint mediator MRC1 domain-containing protein n=1 Tax=Steccherinum ochraceum TaxID=92696 RepID=A0A4R0RHA6_9APHY|nr:hypothetical protein EIP91_012067 [Steccherinum ochraceum]